MEGLDIDNTEFKDIYGFSKATISGIHWNCIPKIIRDHFQVIDLLYQIENIQNKSNFPLFCETCAVEKKDITDLSMMYEEPEKFINLHPVINKGMYHIHVII